MNRFLTATLHENLLTLTGNNYPELFRFNTKNFFDFWNEKRINGKLWTELKVKTIVFSKITIDLEACYAYMDNDYTCVQALITSRFYDDIVFQNIKVIGGEPLQKEFARDIISWLKKMDNPPFILLKLNIPNIEYYKDGCFFPKEDLKENETIKVFRQAVEKMKSFGIIVHASFTPSFFQNRNIPDEIKALLNIIIL